PPWHPCPARRRTRSVLPAFPPCAWGRTTTRRPAPWRSPPRPVPAFPGPRLQPALNGARLVPSSRSCRFLPFGFLRFGICSDHQAMSASARRGLVVIAGDQCSDRAGQFITEGGAILGGSKSNLCVDGECRQALVE